MDSRHLRGLRRGGVRPDGAVGGLAPRRRPHRLGGVAAGHRRQAEPAPGALVAAAADRLRPRGRHQHPVQRRDAAASQYGRGRHGERQRGLRDGTDHRAGGPRGRDPSRVRPGRGHQQQSRQSDHQYPLLRRGPRGGRASGRRGGPRSPGPWDAGDRQAFPGSRRHRHRFASRAAGDRLKLVAARLGGAGAVPKRDRRRREGGDVGPYRPPGGGPRRAAPRHGGAERPHRYSPRLARLRWVGGDRRARHGRHHQRLRRGRLAARLSRRRRPAAPAGRSGRCDRRDGGGRRARGHHVGAARRARSGGCSRPSATSASSPAAPSHSTACPAWSAAPGSSTRHARWRLARW